MARKRGWHKGKIKAAIIELGWTLEGLALANNLPRDACIQALRRPNWGGEMAIAELLGVSPRQLWPARYSPAGEYLHPKSRAYTRRAEQTQCGGIA